MRTRLIVVAVCIAFSSALISSGAVAGTGASTASAACSAATARTLVNAHHMNDFLLQEPVAQVLCGPFAGRGSRAMAVAIAAATCWPVQRWAVFAYSAGRWRLVLNRPEWIVAPLVAVGSEIRASVPVFLPSDSTLCNPSGGTKARLWRWNGTRLSPGPWSWVSAGAHNETHLEFLSPGHDVACEIGDSSGLPAFLAFCHSQTHDLSAEIGTSGPATICTSACAGSPSPTSPTLPYGRALTVGRFRCESLHTGIRCTVTATGEGFLISGATGVRVG